MGWDDRPCPELLWPQAWLLPMMVQPQDRRPPAFPQENLGDRPHLGAPGRCHLEARRAKPAGSPSLGTFSSWTLADVLGAL